MSKSLARGNTRTVTVRWSAWNPFLQANSPHVTVGLIGGPFPSPDGEFVYKVPDTAMQDEISAKAAGGLMAFQWGFSIKVRVDLLYAGIQNGRLENVVCIHLKMSILAIFLKKV